jgi:cytochrome c-type biogenesis protein CcmH/NrfG
VNLGIAYETTARYPESAEAFQQAGRIDPNNVSALNGLGIAQFHMGHREQGNREDADVQLPAKHGSICERGHTGEALDGA